jgi:hypothetical protein
LPSVAWRTGQSGAPPDSPVHHRTVRCTTGHCPVRISFLIWRGRPLQSWSRWRTGQSGAPSDRWHLPCVARGFRGRPLARPTVGSPDSPVHFSRTPPSKSREQPVRQSQPGAPDTVRCPTGQSGAPRLSRLLAASSQTFPVEFPLILTLRQTC